MADYRGGAMVKCWLIFLALAAAAQAEAPKLLATALAGYAADFQRWAFTQTVVETENGNPKPGDVERYDPSQPYEVQWTLLRHDGRAPTDREQAKYRKRRAKEMEKRRTLGELILVDEARLVSESEATAVFEVPLRKIDNVRLPPEKFRVTIQVDKRRQALERIDLTLREAFRIALVGKVKSGGARLEFANVDDRYAPVMARLQGEGSGSILFVKLSGSFERLRSDFKRVKPYDERFTVKIGETKYLDF